ncbi:MAG: transposon-transfer assisting family protein [Clostridiales bacterium]|nr:transposon-transfer assisting family protein [Clostridiales bacterium]
MDYTFFSMEEIDLMWCFDTSDRYMLIEQMEEIAPYIDDPELLALMEQTLDKIYVISDREYAELPLFPTWEDDANELDGL